MTLWIIVRYSTFYNHLGAIGGPSVDMMFNDLDKDQSGTIDITTRLLDLPLSSL